MTPSLHILTLALRPDGAIRVAQSVAAAPRPWPTEHRIVWHHGEPDPTFRSNAAAITRVAASLPAAAWLAFVDDDNLLHPALPQALADVDSPNLAAIIVGMQYAHGVYFPAHPARLVPCSCDGGQLIVRAGLLADLGWRPGTSGDGETLRDLYALVPGRFAFLDRPLSYHNAQRWL